MKIVINADDFGYSEGICRSIMELFEARAISSTTIMVAANGALQRLTRWPVSVLLGSAGVHLQLTNGKPLSSPAEAPSLFDDSGAFLDPRRGVVPDPEDVRTEWRRQIEEAQRLLGGPVTHLDTHHGMHRLPALFAVYIQLASELQIPVRGAGGDLGSRMRRDGISGSVALVRDWTTKSLGADELREQVRKISAMFPSERAIEVIAHPGYSDDYLRSQSSLTDAREDEHRSLLTLAGLGWPEIDGYELSSFSCFSGE